MFHLNQLLHILATRCQMTGWGQKWWQLWQLESSYLIRSGGISGEKKRWCLARADEKSIFSSEPIIAHSTARTGKGKGRWICFWCCLCAADEKNLSFCQNQLIARCGGNNVKFQRRGWRLERWDWLGAADDTILSCISSDKKSVVSFQPISAPNFETNAIGWWQKGWQIQWCIWEDWIKGG